MRHVLLPSLPSCHDASKPGRPVGSEDVLPPYPIQPIYAPPISDPSVLPDSLRPPERFADARFATYETPTSSQARALDIARSFAAHLQESDSLGERLLRALSLTTAPDRPGLYFVGPVGTGKTHLIAAIYHALHPAVPCAYLHSSALFRSTARPDRFATALAARCDVLCLDEVEIDDPANEVRLVRVLHALDDHGVRLLATSNVEPEQFMSNRMSSGRFERFLQKEFAKRYRLVYVGGDDFRSRAPNGPAERGTGWIGADDEATVALRQAYEDASGTARWMSFEALRGASRTTAHSTLMDRLAAYDDLFVADIAIHSTDDALRLLRVIDDLYTRPDAPRFHFSARQPPSAWFRVEDQGAGIAGDIAEKFTRTTSRLQALCTMQHPPSASACS